MATHVEDLLDELLLRILDLLPDSDLINVVPFVCLRWWRYSLDSYIWKNRTYKVGRKSFKIYRQSPSDAVKFFSRKPALRSVAFDHPVDVEVLQSLASHCPTITSLSLDYRQPLSLDTLCVITRNCDQIRYLLIPSEVLNCPDCAREVALMPHLDTLVIHGNQPQQLCKLGAGCATLRHLQLGMGVNVRLGDLGAPLLGRLQELTIGWNSVSPDIVHCAKSLEKLRLEYYHYSSRPDSALAKDLLPLKALTHVEATYLAGGPQVVRAFMQPLLRSLNLSYCTNLDDDLLLELCHSCPLLEDLVVSNCDLITARGLSSMWSLRQLWRLHLDWCINLRSGAMTHLARCNGLQELRMLGVKLYCMEPGVSQLIELRKLRLLVLEAWSARDLIPWESLPKAFPQLRTLELGEWTLQDRSIPESLKAVMPTTQVKWHINPGPFF